MTYAFGALVLVAFFTLVYIVALIRNDYSTVDVFWGMAQVVLVVALTFYLDGHALSHWIIYGAITLWGLRLSWYLYRRNWHKPEDFRYQAMRKKWVKFEKLQAYIKVYLLQSGFALLMGITVISMETLSLRYLGVFIAGAVLFAVGFIFETLADEQMMAFQKIKKPGEILTTGVWKLSRHPNYFGEVTVWWGVGIMALAHANTLLVALLMLISPITITYLLLGLSGIPILEKRYDGDPNYEAYRKNTRAFFPFPKK